MFALLLKSLPYFLAIVTSAIATTARFLLEPAIGDVAQFLLFILSVVVAAWKGGLGPGLLATMLGVALSDYFFVEPLYSFHDKNLEERLDLFLFLCTGISISVLSHARKSAEAKSRQLLVSERDARRVAEDASRLKDEFLSTVSHELRTPLTAINGWAMMLRSGRLDAAQSDHAVETIVRNAKAQNQLIDDLLDVSRIISGKLRLQVAPLNLVPIIEAAVDTIRPAAEAKGIHLDVWLDTTAEKVSGDTERLQQVVWNLLSNGVKFTPNGGRVEVRLERVTSQVEIVVADNGQGIKPEFLPYVFEHFRQEDSGTSRQQGGLGLGLAIVRQIVDLHGGTIHAASEGPGKGAKFTVVLPIAEARAGSPAELRGKSEGGRLVLENPPSLAGVRG